MFKDSSESEYFEQKGTTNEMALFDTVKHLKILGVFPPAVWKALLKTPFDPHITLGEKSRSVFNVEEKAMRDKCLCQKKFLLILIRPPSNSRIHIVNCSLLLWTLSAFPHSLFSYGIWSKKHLFEWFYSIQWNLNCINKLNLPMNLEDNTFSR